MNKILIIGDTHGRSFWKEPIQQYGDECDKIIFLGDYVDPYMDENITRKEAINILEEIITFKKNNKDKTILLLGNHDVHYTYPNFPRSTRYDSSHAYNIRGLYMSHISLFQLAHEEILNDKKYLFTHAGLMNSWAKKHQDIIGEPTTENLNRLASSKRGIDALGQVSKYRTWLGEESGSILWSDLREKIDKEKSNEDNIIPNEDSIAKIYDYQIFGHTRVIKPIITNKWACIDCKQALILNNNGELKPC